MTDGLEEVQPQQQEEDDRVCRICQERGDVEDLRRPCSCRGSVEWVHAQCLVQWIEPALAAGRRPTCELCKTPYRISFRVPHTGIAGFLFGRHAPPVVARAWLALVWCAATAVLYLAKRSFLFKALAWSAGAAASWAMAVHSRRRGTADTEPGHAAARICSALSALPAIGFASLVASTCIWGSFSPFGSATPVSWHDTEVVALAGIYIGYLLSIGLWSIVTASRGVALLVTVSGSVSRAWQLCDGSVRSWLVLVTMGSISAAFWVVPDCTTKIAIFGLAAAMLLLLTAAAFVWASDFATASSLFIAAFYLLVVASGFVLTFVGAFPATSRDSTNSKRRPADWNSALGGPSMTDATGLVWDMCRADVLAAQRSGTPLEIEIPAASSNISAILACGNPDNLLLDHTLSVWDRLDFGCTGSPSAWHQRAFTLVDDGECALGLKLSSTTASGSLGILLAARVPGQLDDDLLVLKNGSDACRPEGSLPVVMLPWSEAWILRHAVSSGRRAELSFHVPKRHPSDRLTLAPCMRPFDIAMLGHVESVLREAVLSRERPLFSDGRAVRDVAGSTEAQRLLAALARKCGPKSDCVLDCPQQASENSLCKVYCSGATSPCSLDNYCQFGRAGPCQYVSVIHYIGLTFAMYGTAVLAAIGMLIGAAVLQAHDWIVRVLYGEQAQPLHAEQEAANMDAAAPAVQQQQAAPAAAAAAPMLDFGEGIEEGGEDLWVILAVFVAFVCIAVNAFSVPLAGPQRAATALVTGAVTAVPFVQVVAAIASKYPPWRSTGEGIVVLNRSRD